MKKNINKIQINLKRNEKCFLLSTLSLLFKFSKENSEQPQPRGRTKENMIQQSFQSIPFFFCSIDHHSLPHCSNFNSLANDSTKNCSQNSLPKDCSQKEKKKEKHTKGVAYHTKGFSLHYKNTLQIPHININRNETISLSLSSLLSVTLSTLQIWDEGRGAAIVLGVGLWVAVAGSVRVGASSRLPSGVPSLVVKTGGGCWLLERDLQQREILFYKE